MLSNKDSDALAGEINANKPAENSAADTPQQAESQDPHHKKHGMTPGTMPHIPTARERAKEMDERRRSTAHTFEL